MDSSNSVVGSAIIKPLGDLISIVVNVPVDEMTRTPELEKTISENVFSYEGMEWQNIHGTRNPEPLPRTTGTSTTRRYPARVNTLCSSTQFCDHQNNLVLYPQWQKYLCDHQPPVLVVLGRNDAFFPVSGAEGYRRDVTDIDYNILDTGYFAL